MKKILIIAILLILTSCSLPAPTGNKKETEDRYSTPDTILLDYNQKFLGITFRNDVYMTILTTKMDSLDQPRVINYYNTSLRSFDLLKTKVIVERRN